MSKPRGQWWEITYEPSAPAFQAFKLRKESLNGHTGLHEQEVSTDKRTRALNTDRRDFRRCDFNHFELADASFANCQFEEIRFVKATFENVKFSRCDFTTCHFLNVSFTNCQFIGCTFSNISASAEHVHFDRTSINAEHFIAALRTNLDHIPNGTSRPLNLHFFRHARAKIARELYISVRDEPDIDLSFSANKVHERALHRGRIASAIWKPQGKRLVSAGWKSRLVLFPLRTVGYAIVEAAGFLTDWGRSPSRSLLFLALNVAAFAALYYQQANTDLNQAILRSLDCSLVFGYTKHGSTTDAGASWTTFCNAFFGLCWYALLIPTLSRRVLR